MKRNILLIILIVVGYVAHAQYDMPGNSNAISRQTSNYSEAKEVSTGCQFEVGAFLTPGLSTIGYKPSDATKGLSVGFNGGVDFRIKPEDLPFWWSFGFSFVNYNSKSTYQASITTPTKVDPIWGYNYELETKLTDFQEKQSLWTLGLPIGLYWDIDNFRIGAGMELSAAMSANYRLTSGKLATRYHDVDLDVWFDSDMEAHGVGTATFNNEPKKTLDCKRVLLSPFVDLAYNLDPFSIGLYFGYDLVNLYRSKEYSETALVTLSDDKMHYNGVLQSDQVKGIHPWTVGVRIRFFAPLKVNDKENARLKWENAKSQRKIGDLSRILDSISSSPNTSVSPNQSAEANHTFLAISLQTLRNIKPSENAIIKTLDEYDEVEDVEWKKKFEGDYEALKNYNAIYKEFKKIIDQARRDITEDIQSKVAQDCKKKIENVGYWKNRTNNNYRYSYLDQRIEAIIGLINESVTKGVKMDGSVLEARFLEVTKGF